ncbi:MAG: hypothetical protein ACI9EF_002752 [Pseudohongiellaceae bacterium]|jgi:hypothetical protein
MTTLGAHPSLDTPLPAHWTVARGLQAYLDENGFLVEAYDQPRAPMSQFGLRLSIPNPPRQRWAVRLHDLHHVATGYSTNPTGEGQISAW